jgi:transcriptional regulator with XRE-family HTH domain
MRLEPISHNVRHFRKLRGMTQAELAKAAGTTQYTVSEIELAHREPHPATLRKLAAALGVRVADFYGEPDSPLAEAPPSSLQPPLNGFEEERQRPGLDQVRDAFAPLADGLHRYCARWEEKLPNLRGTHEEVADFVSDFGDFHPIIMRVFADELYAIAVALDLGNRYGEGGLPREMAVGFVQGETEEHSLMRKALERYLALGHALAERTGNKEMAETMERVLAEAAA